MAELCKHIEMHSNNNTLFFCTVESQIQAKKQQSLSDKERLAIAMENVSIDYIKPIIIVSEGNSRQ